MSRPLQWILTLLVGACVLPATVGAKGGPQRFAVGQEAPLPIVFDASNSPHLFYQTSDYQRPDIRPYHAWISNGKWKSELIDPVNDSGSGLSAAIDSTGVIHVSYGGHDGVSRLVYARRDADGWTVTEVGARGRYTAIRVDADDQPHILFVDFASLRYAHLEGSTWIVEDTGISTGGGVGLDLAVDSDGFMHIVYEGAGVNYATNASGDWVSTRLLDGLPRGGFSIAVDAEGVPHVVVAEVTDVVHFSRPGELWTSEVVIENSRILGLSIDGIHLAIGPNDSLHMIVGASVGDRWMMPFYVFWNGGGWSVFLVDHRNNGYWPTIQPDHEGTMYATFSDSGSKKGSTLYWVALPLADLTGSWQAVTLSTRGGSTTISGDLEVANLGAGASARAHVALWLSDDPILSGDDVPLTTRPSGLKSIKPGETGRVRVRLRYPGIAPSGYLIADLDPEDEVADLDSLNNVVVTPMP